MKVVEVKFVSCCFDQMFALGELGLLNVATHVIIGPLDKIDILEESLRCLMVKFIHGFG